MIKIFFKRISKSEHYKEKHEHQVPWSKVIELIFTIKDKRRKGNKIQIENDRFYILCEIDNEELIVINAKRK